ncbi:6-phosphofructokinase [Candidatus Acetothermia bacterium]|jgi:6-phosphofructokinase 1|nr:6-phosphofructokinase [Candidatus Acetothermia bacterium]MCI2426921.1 6-phosphofructokinase [Candidatus Acetothermia bacterium]MCI2428876.1 6-phosphofructokinase [Candidatus Acetothermia bacterium]
MKRIGLLTSGGDSPGMNAAIRAIVRRGSDINTEILGIRRGFNGLIDGDVVPLDNRDVGGIIERGGTILRSARATNFLTASGQENAIATVVKEKIDGLIVIGGDGSLRGARRMHEYGVATIGIPASIDNDISGTTISIGVDTALNTAVDALNKIRDTAYSHERVFVVEMMGRRSGYIALMSGLAGGAEIILIPEVKVSFDEVYALIDRGYQLGKRHSIIAVAEGFCSEGSSGRLISEFLREKTDLEIRLTILGHLQRGGSPTAFDRILASRFGAMAIELLVQGISGKMIVLTQGEITAIPLEEIDHTVTNVDLALYRLAYSIAS